MASTTDATAASDATAHTNTSKIEQIFTVDSIDCYFQFDDTATGTSQRLGAHQRLLSSLSPVFGAMFGGKWTIGEAIAIKDASPAAFAAFLKFFYRDTTAHFTATDLTETNVAEITYLAHKYLVDELIAGCVQFLVGHLTPNGLFDALSIAIRFDLARLQAACADFVGRNTDQVLRAEPFYQCDIKTLTAIVRASRADGRQEAVFDACIDWAKIICLQKGVDATQPANLRTELDPCFAHIRFTEMGRPAFAERYEQYAAMFRRHEIDRILVAMLQAPGPEEPQAACKCEADDEETEAVLTQNRVVFQFHRTDHWLPTMSTVSFQLGRPLLLTSMAFSGVFVRGTSCVTAIEFTATIKVKRLNDTIATWAFKRAKRSEGGRAVAVRFPRKLYIDAGRTHAVSVLLRGESPQYGQCHGYRCEGVTVDGIGLRTIGSDKHSIVESITFEPCDDEQLRTNLHTLPSIPDRHQC